MFCIGMDKSHNVRDAGHSGRIALNSIMEDSVLNKLDSLFNTPAICFRAKTNCFDGR